MEIDVVDSAASPAGDHEPDDLGVSPEVAADLGYSVAVSLKADPYPVAPLKPRQASASSFSPFSVFFGAFNMPSFTFHDSGVF